MAASRARPQEAVEGRSKSQTWRGALGDQGRNRDLRLTVLRRNDRLRGNLKDRDKFISK